jgi:large subunit ribosomal protein L18
MPRADKNETRLRVHRRIRRRVAGDADRPRLAVYRSIAHIYAQVIDDRAGRTIVSASSNDKALRRRAAISRERRKSAS